MEAVVSPAFWRGKRVFVTGHTGFKGAWLSLWLHKLGARLSGYSLPPATQPSLFEAAKVESLVPTTYGDIRDPERLTTAVRHAEPDVVLHLAAQALVRRSYSDPVETYATNVMGTVHLLEAVRACPSVRATIVVTSDKCYENREWLWAYRENEPMGGFDPYSSSKGCAELVTAAYRRSFFGQKDSLKRVPALASVRAGNIIGGGDWAEDRLIPDLTRAAFAHTPALIRNPGAIRPWQHVLGPAHGYLLLAQKLWENGADFAEAWNFGPADDESRPVAWVADKFSEFWRDGASWRAGDGSAQPHEAQYLRLDSSKARSRLGWQPRWNIEHGLRRTIEWHLAHNKGVDMRRFSLNEIATYESGEVEAAYGTV